MKREWRIMLFSLRIIRRGFSVSKIEAIVSWGDMELSENKKEVADACGSKSISNTFLFLVRFSKIPDKFAAKVVLPTPPFWIPTAIILGKRLTSIEVRIYHMI
jgi:hypothetical protein